MCSNRLISNRNSYEPEDIHKLEVAVNNNRPYKAGSIIYSNPKKDSFSQQCYQIRGEICSSEMSKLAALTAEEADYLCRHLDNDVFILTLLYNVDQIRIILDACFETRSGSTTPHFISRMNQRLFHHQQAVRISRYNVAVWILKSSAARVRDWFDIPEYNLSLLEIFDAEDKSASYQRLTLTQRYRLAALLLDDMSRLYSQGKLPVCIGLHGLIIKQRGDDITRVTIASYEYPAIEYLSNTNPQVCLTLLGWMIHSTDRHSPDEATGVQLIGFLLCRLFHTADSLDYRFAEFSLRSLLTKMTSTSREDRPTLAAAIEQFSGIHQTLLMTDAESDSTLCKTNRI